MKWNIITDSSCDMFGFEKEHENIVFSSVPFTISVGDENFVDDRNLDVDGMIDSMDACAEASHTACPSPHAWQEKFEQEGNVIAITISSKLSGSYNSACAAKDMVLEEQPDKKIAVIDSRSTGPEMVLLVKKICELIESGADFETVVEKAELYSRHTHVVFALSSFNNLVKNGRMSKIVGFVANKLGFWGIGIGSEQGTIEIKQKIRGSKKALDAIIEDMKERGLVLIIKELHETIDRLTAEVAKVLQMPDVQSRLRGLGGEPGAISRDRFAAMNRAGLSADT